MLLTKNPTTMKRLPINYRTLMTMLLVCGTLVFNVDAFGQDVSAFSNGCFTDAEVTGYDCAAAIGSGSLVTVDGGIAIGTNSKASVNGNSIAIGNGASASGSGSVSVGQNSLASGTRAQSFGHDGPATRTRDNLDSILQQVEGILSDFSSVCDDSYLYQKVADAYRKRINYQLTILQD